MRLAKEEAERDDSAAKRQSVKKREGEREGGERERE